MTEKMVKLKVAEAVQDDVNKGIVRVDSNFMYQIEAKPGDIVLIKGERETVGIVDRAYPGDIGLNIIRMDGIIRRNAKTGIGESVEVKKADIKEAKKVTIAPAQKGVVIRASPNIFKQGLLGRAVVKGDIVSLGGTRRRRSAMTDNPFFNDIFSMMDDNMSGFGFSDLKFIVASTDPKMPVIITEQTEVIFNPEAVEMKEEKVLEVTYEDIGGLDEEIKKIREMVELPLKHPEIFEQLGIEPPKGVLLHGPPGTGKTLLAKAVANETNSNFILINGPEIMSKFYGQSEANLRKKFEDAEKNAPSIIFFDEVDAIAPKREDTHGEVERRVVAQLLANMDGLQSRGKVVVIAATNRPDDIDPALRRPGRFDRELEIGVPSKESRLAVLKIHTRNMPILGEFNVKNALSIINAEIEKSTRKHDKENSEKAEKAHVSSDKQKKVRSDKGIDALQALKQSDPDAYSELMSSVVSALLEIETSVEIWNAEDPAQKYNELSKKQNGEAYRVLGELIEAKIIKKEFYNLVRLKDVPNLLAEIAGITYGFVGADLSSLAKEAAMNVLRRILPDIKLKEDEPIPKEVLEKLKITKQDFKEALKVVRPSAMREVLVEIPNIKWDDVGGLEEVKQELKEAVEWPLKYPQAFKRLGVRPPRGILLYGAPGTGKTLLAKAVANESQANFILVKGPEMLSKWVGESERAVRKIFKKARQTAPTIIFFDEIDSIAPRRGLSQDNNVAERVVNQLLTEIDGLEELNDVVVIAATNRPDIIDTGLLRPGRFDRIVQTPVPDERGREIIFKIHTEDMPLKGVDLKALAKDTEGYAGADIEAVCREAAILALRDNIEAKEVTKKYFQKALEKVQPSATEEIKKSYDELKKMFTSAKGREFQKEKPNYFG
jgi:transitional endoplasmic reticulum ATPase